MGRYQGFGTIVGCIDGRSCRLVSDWLTMRYDVKFPDMVTEEGIIKYISEGCQEIIERVKRKTNISRENHNSPVMVIVGHGDCAANPGLREEQVRQVYDSYEVIKTWGRFQYEHGLWIDESFNLEVIF